MSVFFFDSAFVSDPSLAGEIDLDDRDRVEYLFSSPVQVRTEEEKRQAPVICGARYFPTALNREKDNVEHVETLILDIDAAPVSEQQLLAALAGLRAIVYTSPRHTPEAPRWRVLLPLLVPLPPKKHRPLIALLSNGLVPGVPGCINVESTGDCTRLGFFGASFHPEHYKFFNLKGTPFDWTSLVLEDEVWNDAERLGGMERSSLWTPRDVALRKCLKKYDGYAYGLKRGDGRSKRIWDVALNVWWAWAAEDEDFVMTVLRHVNDQFDEPEDEAELDRQMREAHKRTVGERRQPQGNGTYGWAREPENLIGHAAIMEHAKRLRRKKTTEMVAVGDALKRLARGETLSDDPEAWRGLVTKCAHELARAFPHETSERITQQFRASLSAMTSVGKADVPLEAEVYAFVQTKQIAAVRNIEVRHAQKEQAVSSAIDTGTYGERDKPYTREELDNWRQHAGLTEHNWVVVNGRSVYVFSNGTWIGPFDRDLEFEAQGRKALLAAQDKGGVKVFFFDEDGKATPVPLKDIVNAYGCVSEVRIDMSCDRAYFSTEDNTLVLAGPKRNKLEPTYHEEVDIFLRILGGRDARPSQLEAERWSKNDAFDSLCDWLASFPELQYPCKALYLEGPPGIGKGLFADGLARYYKAGSISLDKAVHQFNAQLAQSPYILVDEGMPDMKKPGDVLRRMLSTHEHDVTRKNKDTVKVYGCVRLLFTANNIEFFRELKQRLKTVDLAAIEARIIHIEVSTERGKQLTAYLKALGSKHHDFVNQDMIAEHMLWLHQQRWAAIHRRDERFLVLNPAPDARHISIGNAIAVTSGMSDTICEHVIKGVVEKMKNDWLFVRDGEVLVRAPKMAEYLQIQGGLQAGSELSHALKTLSKTYLSEVRRLSGKPTRVWVLSNEALKAWCDTTNLFEWEDVLPVLEASKLVGEGQPA